MVELRKIMSSWGQATTAGLVFVGGLVLVATRLIPRLALGRSLPADVSPADATPGAVVMRDNVASRATERSFKRPQVDKEELRRRQIVARLEGEWMAIYGDGLSDDPAASPWPVSYINAQLIERGESWQVEFRAGKLHIVER